MSVYNIRRAEGALLPSELFAAILLGICSYAFSSGRRNIVLMEKPNHDWNSNYHSRSMP